MPLRYRSHRDHIDLSAGLVDSDDRVTPLVRIRSQYDHDPLPNCQDRGLLDEIEPLAADDVDVIVIGTGWQGIAVPDPEILDAFDCQIVILRTGEAVREYNRLRGEGKRVAMLIHTTC